MNKLKKRAWRLCAVMLSAVLVLAFSATAAFGAQEGDETGGSIEIDNAVVGQKYSAYQLMYLESYDASKKAYAYKANSVWSEWLKTQTSYVKIDDQGYVTWVDGASAAEFAKAAQEYAESTEGVTPDTDVVTADATTVQFNNLKLGYYLVDTSLGALCSLDTTNPAAKIEEKNGQPTNVKTVEEDSAGNYGEKNDADLGQTVNFKSTITAQPGAEKYVFHDKMSTGLTYTGVTGITLNGKTVAASSYTVVTEGLTDGCTFEVAFTQAFCDTLEANDKIVISYSATLNKDAVVAGAGNENKSQLTYGDGNKTEFSPTTTYTWDVDIFKYAKDGETETPLAGATFTLSKNADGSSPIALVAKGNNVYRVAVVNDADTVTEITTGDTGKFTIEGLDSDTYYLTETTAPAGYNKLAGPITIVIGEDGSTSVDNKTVEEVEVLNNSGSELPSTGGMGTTILYVIGGLLVVGAGVALVVRRRVNAGK